MEHGATGVVAPDWVHGLGHARNDDNNRSCNNSDDGEVKIKRRMLGMILTCRMEAVVWPREWAAETYVVPLASWRNVGVLADSSGWAMHVKMLRYKYPHTKIVAAEFYKPFLTFLDMPGDFGELVIYGLNSSTTLLACCGAGGPPYNYDFNAGCGLPGVKACADPSQALHWDGFYLTESAYRAITDGWLHGPYADPPILHIAR
ncbi:hypothetical protein TRIUR3_23496 [Triticum urartu]|uniref:GDSL esterase/lipase n=1 Tax=Triticum urartu TaxID=4572 RepID=M7ZHD5_TRIUA|nr:hypothetical protein TRIUR3_23496 [Triticum urartu]